MANAASTIEIELEIRQAINRLDNLQRQLSKSTQSFDKAAQATRKFEGAINKAKAGMVAFFAAISLQKLAQLSDAMTQFENRVKLATNSLVQQLAVQQQLFLVAQKTALPLEDVGQLYSRLRIAAEQLGASQRDLINLTETVGLALKASGTSAASAQGALLQLGQALNSPRVQAEEFNSLIDGMPNLLREVEKQLGLTAGGLKKFVTDGQLSNKKFFDAILASQNALTQQANSSASTIEQANQRVANSFTSLIGAIDDKLGASKFFTGFIDGLASGIDKLSNFLGLTTQATGGGGGANLDEVIRGAAPSGSQYAFPTIGPDRATAAIGGFPNYISDIKSLQEIKELEDGLLEIRIEQAESIAQAVNSNKETVDILGAQNVPLNEAVGFLNLENKLIDSNIQKRKIELQQNKENLTYLEQATNYLKEQFGLNDRTAGAIVSGISGAGPNASRAINIAQSKSPEEAAAKLILSNEKVAKAIDSSFELLFEVLDPFIDLLGDLISAINRLIGALAKGIGDGIQSVLDQAGVGQDSYLFGGGFARDFEQFGYDISGGMFGVNNRDTGLSRDEYNAYSLGISGLSGQETIDDLLRNLSSVGLTGVLEGEDYKKVIEEINALARKGDATDQQRAQLLNNAAAAQTLLFDRIEEQAKQISNSEALSLLEEINQRGIERNEIDQIRINYSREIKEVSENLILTEEDQIRVITALEEARNREIEAIERQKQLLDVQTGGDELTKILDTLEDTFDRIIDLVEDLKDQTLNLLFSDKSLAPASVRFTTAATRYQELLAAALDPDATEENVKEFQAFVDTYLKSAQDVFKSSSQYQNIFDSVLADIEEVSNFVSIAMPINEIESVKKQLVEVAEEFGIGIEEVITGLDNLSRSLIYQAIIANVPVEAYVDSEASDLVIEAVVTAIADPVRSDTEIEAVVNAIMGAGSDTQIDAIVKAVQAPGSDTTIKAVVNAIAASSSDLQIEAVVSAVANQQLSDLQIEAIVTAVKASGSDTEIEAIVTAVEDKILSDTEIEAIVTAKQSRFSNTVISAIVSAVAATGSDTQIEAIVTAIMAYGSNTQIKAIVTAIMASGSDTQIEAIVSAVASNTPVISAIVAAVAANTPVVTPNITLNDSNISAAFDSLSQTLENSIGSLIATIQLQGMLATATAEGIYSKSARSFKMDGLEGVTSGLSVDLKPRGDFSDYGLAEGVQFTGALSTQDQFSALINSAEDVNPAIRNNPYYVLFPAAETGNTTIARLFGFTDLSKAKDFYNYYSSRTLSYINDNGTLKYGFQQGGLVPGPMDTIPAMLSPGEYILSPETVRRYGVSNLNRLNSGDSAALNATSDPEVKRLLAELIVAVKENDTEVNVFTDMQGQTKASIEEFRSELRERTRRQGDKFLPARYI